MYQNLHAAAQADPAILRILTSGVEHTVAVEQINQQGEFKTSDTSVRRWRSKWMEHGLDEMMPGGTGSPDDELAEDIGDGMGLDDEETHVAPGWKGWGESDRDAFHSKLDAALDAVGASPEDVAGLRISSWQTVTKDSDNEPQVTDLYGVKLLVKTKDLTPAWPVVQPATPTTVSAVPSSGRPMRGEQVAVILPDPQIGYRHYIDSGEFDPFHDEAAMNVAMQIVRDVSPDLVLCLGDFLDLPAFGRYEQEQAFAATTQKSIDRGHRFLAELRAVAPDARMVVLEGNHDRRLQNMIVNNAKAAFGLRRAIDTTGWPVLSVPYLCGFDALEVQYVEGYPAGQFWINDNLRAIHGTKVRSSGSTAAAVVRDDDVSTIFGHIHRIETEYLTRQNRNGGKTLVAHTPGCLCRIDGAVPSVKGSTDLMGRPIESYENWQQAVSLVRFEPGDGGFAIEPMFIDTSRGHRARYGGKVYTPNTEEE